MFFFLKLLYLSSFIMPNLINDNPYLIFSITSIEKTTAQAKKDSGQGVIPVHLYFKNISNETIYVGNPIYYANTSLRLQKNGEANKPPCLKIKADLSKRDSLLKLLPQQELTLTYTIRVDELCYLTEVGDYVLFMSYNGKILDKNSNLIIEYANLTSNGVLLRVIE